MGLKNIHITLSATLPNHKVPFSNMRVEVSGDYEVDGLVNEAETELKEFVWKLFREECKKAREAMDK